MILAMIPGRSVRYGVREHRIPTPDARPTIIARGPDANVWFCESGAGKIGRLSTRDGTLAEFPLPDKDAMPIGIVAGADGNLWFTEARAH